MSTIIDFLKNGMLWFTLIMLTLIILLHVGLFKLAQLTAGISIFNEDNYTAVKWLAFVIYEASLGLGLTAVLVVIWGVVADEFT